VDGGFDKLNLNRAVSQANDVDARVRTLGYFLLA
jgi:hypothetical protein